LRLPLRFAAFVTALLLTPAAAHAWTYGDTLTTIWRPLPNLPALARPGDAFTVWADAPSTTSGWSASLLYGGLVIPATPNGGGYVTGKLRWELSYRVPAGTPEAIYDLVITSNTTLADTSKHAVKVLRAYQGDYYFAQISDTHLPEHTTSDVASFSVNDTTGMADFDAIIDDLNVLHPEFILHTGDLVNEGELEEYLNMYEMGRAKAMLSRLRDPIFVVSGNHDQGGWKPTPPPDGTSKKNWWRYFGWPNLLTPPPDEPFHSQDYSFDYGPLHLIGLETYINNGSYDSFRTDLYGAQSFTPEQLAWLRADSAAVAPGTHRLAFYHYDFGGTTATGTAGANFSQINPAALGLDGAIWGHNHGVAEGNRTVKPFNLGLQAVIDGRRTFRIFRVHNGVMTPGPMHHSGGTTATPTDSLTLLWGGANDGSLAALDATVNNRFNETWDHARLTFVLADHDSAVRATGGTISQVVRASGRLLVDVDVALPAQGSAHVSVAPFGPFTAGVGEPGIGGVRLAPPAPDPFVAGAGALTVRWSLPHHGRTQVAVFDVTGREVARLYDGLAPAGESRVAWDGRRADGAAAPAGVYLIRLQSADVSRTARIALLH
jgi:hypothetical protein